jgi:hypothetical protein
MRMRSFEGMKSNFAIDLEFSWKHRRLGRSLEDRVMERFETEHTQNYGFSQHVIQGFTIY